MKTSIFFLFISFSCIAIASFGQLPLSGNYTIGGAAPSYSTINAAVNDLKAKGVSGAVTFKIRPGTYPERVVIPDILGAGAQNTITFQSESGRPQDVIITSAGGGTVASCYTVQLRATKYIILDKLTVVNTHPTYAIGIHLATSVQETSEFNIIRNCIVKLDSISDDIHLYGIATSDPNITTANAGTYTNNTFENNFISGGYYGIYNFIQSVLTSNTQTYITNNFITGTYYCGIFLRYAVDFQVNRNMVRMRAVATPRATCYGIYSYQTGGGLIANNAVIADLTNTSDARGIFMGGGLYTNPVRLSYNSVKIIGDNNSSVGYSSELLIPSILRNNIFSNYAGGAAAEATSTTAYTDANYNDFYTNGAILTQIPSGSNNTSLASHQTASGQDANSLAVDPRFLDIGDYHILNSLLESKGEAVVGITVDKENETRATTPDIGADEFTIPATDLALRNVTLTPASDPGSKIITVMLRNEGNASLAGKTISLSFSTDGGTTWSGAESYTIQNLATLLSVEDYTFTSVATFTQPGLQTFCVRIDPPGITGDSKTSNDRYCTEYCHADTKSIYTIGGAGSDFSGIAAAVDFLKALPCGVSMPVTFNISPGTYAEKITIPFIRGTSESSTITFQSSTETYNDVTIEGLASSDSSKTAILTLDGGSFIRFNQVTFKNTSLADGCGIRLMNGAEENRVDHCRILLETDAPSEGISVTFQSINNHLLSNVIRGGSTGIDVSLSDASDGMATEITGNSIEEVKETGIQVEGSDSTFISGNRITFAAGNEESTGIYVKGIKSGFTIDANFIQNAVTGILAEDLTTELPTLISNNMITGSPAANVSVTGIGLRTCQPVHVLHNSVYIPSGASASSTAFKSTTSVSLFMQNNLFYNTSNGYSYSIDEEVGLDGSDYNYLYSTGSSLAFLQGDKDLNNLQTAGYEGNSLTGALTFTNGSSDLHNPHSALDGKGSYIASVPFDFDGEPRDQTTPDIGADEFDPLGMDDASLLSAAQFYPNPAANKLFVLIPGQSGEALTISLFNLLGETIVSETNITVNNTEILQLTIPQLPDGIYLVRIQAADQQITQRICIRK